MINEANIRIPKLKERKFSFHDDRNGEECRIFSVGEEEDEEDGDGIDEEREEEEEEAVVVAVEEEEGKEDFDRPQRLCHMDKNKSTVYKATLILM